MKIKGIIAAIFVTLCIVYVWSFKLERSFSDIIRIDPNEIKEIFIWNYAGTELLITSPDEINKIVGMFNTMKVKKSFRPNGLVVQHYFKTKDGLKRIDLDLSHTNDFDLKVYDLNGKFIKSESTLGNFQILYNEEYYPYVTELLAKRGKPSGSAWP